MRQSLLLITNQSLLFTLLINNWISLHLQQKKSLILLFLQYYSTTLTMPDIKRFVIDDNFTIFMNSDIFQFCENNNPSFFSEKKYKKITI